MESLITLFLLMIFLIVVFMVIKNDYKFEFDNLINSISKKDKLKSLIKKEEKANIQFKKLKFENKDFYNNYVVNSKLLDRNITPDEINLIKLSKQIEIYRYEIYNLCRYVSNNSNVNFNDYISGVIDYKVDFTEEPSLILITNN